jgi:hypothetical protein
VTAPLAYSELLELAWVAPIAVLVVAVSYSGLLLGATRAAELRKDGHAGTAAAYGGLAIVSGLVFGAAVVAGLAVIVAG